MLPRTGTTAALAVLAGCTAVLTLSGCYIDVGKLQHRVNTYSVSAQVHTLVVSGGLGDVNVTGGAGQVSVTERISYRHGVPHPRHAVHAGKLTLSSNCPGNETCSVEYHVRVPAGTTVRISDSVGKISLAGLTGRVTAHTNAGGIDLKSLSGTIQATEHAGSISGTGVSSAHAALSTNVGSIDVTFSAAPASVTATANVGSISLRLPGGVPYAVDANTRVGGTHVTVPRSAGSAHAITARTQTGSVTIRPA
jgi:hypothetical protein